MAPMRTQNTLDGVRGLLFDMDGVLYVEQQRIPGAAEVLEHIKRQGVPCRFITNRSTKSIDSLHTMLSAMGFPIKKDEILSSPYAAVLYLREVGNPSCFLVLSEDTKTDFSEFHQSMCDPDVVVIGDIGRQWNYSMLNQIFRLVMDGAEMIALHKGRFWQVEDGLHIDIGAFVAGLEYATGKTARVMGKPSESIFKMALQQLGLQPSEAAMVGDDIDSDIGGAQNVGVRGILIKTGKYRVDLATRSTVKPDAILETVSDLRNFF